MAIAFLIIAHADADHLRRLTAHLSGHHVFVHWDRKAGPPPAIPGVTFAEERVSVFWAGFSQIDATAALLRTALSKGRTYDKIVLLSGSCYPIRPIAALQQLFTSDGNHNYINAVRVNDSPHLTDLVRQRLWRDQVLPLWLPRTPLVLQVERILRAAANVVLCRVPKSLPPGLELFHGSQWWALSHEAAAYALDVYDSHRALRRFYAFTFASDEQFFQTVVRNSRFADFCDPPTPYVERGTWRTANLHIIDRSLTKWFGLDDVDTVARSDRFFVRKVRSRTSGPLLDWIDAVRLA